MPTINVNNILASETAKGVVEEATQAELNAGTDTGATGARLFAVPSKILSLLGSYLTTASAAATYQTIAGLFASVMGLVLTGFTVGANTAIAATDTLAQALAKIQGQINARATLTGAETLTNKRLTPRVQAVVSSATVTPSADNDDEVVITAQAAGLTLANPSGTPVQGQGLIVRIKDNGTARAIAYGSEYRAIGVFLPTTTAISKTVYLGFISNTTDTKWDCIGVSQEI